MTTLALEVSRIRARVFPVRGEAQDMEFFLRPIGGRFETLGERLNDPAATFVPVLVDDGTEFLRLRAVAHLEVEARLPEIAALEEMGASRHRVSVVMLTGDRFQGDLIYLLPPESARISDFLNSDHSRFVLLDLGERCLYAQRDAIARIRQEQDGTRDAG